ncbi:MULTISPECIES: STAS domain-containing protein [Streptomyces]|uniref:STAS domain-containing protein n=1 Tax=Streptomyces TaxID=1883 RepID=UPI0013D9F70E|nr:STAS domain-containing protein [Streptomyces aureoverticillatus]QIB47675.1 STAS domain-containing protein [Streptomyces aureoverticillatus]
MTPTPATVCVKEVRPHGTCTLVVLCGEIDIHTAPDVTLRLDALTYSGGADILIDLRAVEFMDCAGVWLFERVRARTSGRHGRLRLICTRPATLHLLNHPRLSLGFDILDRLPAPLPPQAAA